MEEQNQYNREEQQNFSLEQQDSDKNLSETVLSEQEEKTDDDFSIFIDLVLSFLLILSVFTFWLNAYAGIALFIITTLFIFISYFRKANKPYSKDIIKKFPITAIGIIMWLLCVLVSFKLFFNSNLSDREHNIVFIPFFATFLCIWIPAILKNKKPNAFLRGIQRAYVVVFLLLEFLARLLGAFIIII